jgi:hypothetical protein
VRGRETPLHSPLLTLLSDTGGLQRARAAAPILWPDAAPDVAFLKACFALAGWPSPAARTVPELVSALCAWRFQAVPAALQPPAGDLWVGTDERRVPVGVGFVQKVSTDGAWFYAVTEAPERFRVDRATVDFWLRPPHG